ncbi:hypothetical protein AGMMS50293_10280 [Spirochaetia bacterium]|nr:hypothetical protein AGMMS50293_10280 [Spirochaetia bacterium]
MTQQAELYRRIDTLPPKYFVEVIDFVGHLEQKARKELDPKAAAAKDGNGKLHFTKKEWEEFLQSCPITQSLTGILSDMGDVDLDEWRMKRLAKHL